MEEQNTQPAGSPSSSSGTTQPFEWQGPQAKTPFPPYNDNVQPAEVPFNTPIFADSSVALVDSDGQKTSDQNKKKDAAWMGVVKSKIDKRRERGWKGFKANVTKNWNDLRNGSGQMTDGVTLNGYPLSPAQVRWFKLEFSQIALREQTHYWYDADSGWIGKVGGKRKFVCDPHIEGILGDLHPHASVPAAADNTDGSPSGPQQQQRHCLMSNHISLNGRLVSQEEVDEFKMLNCDLQGQTAYRVAPNGDVFAVQDKNSTEPLCNWRQQRKIRNRNVKPAKKKTVLKV